MVQPIVRTLFFEFFQTYNFGIPVFRKKKHTKLTQFSYKKSNQNNANHIKVNPDSIK